MINRHAAECQSRVQQVADRCDDPSERALAYRKLAGEYAAKCDGLEATLRRAAHPAFAPAWTDAR